jgi:hypothetical protein
MSDIVKRLRDRNVSHVDADIWMMDAADRIEALEAQLAAAEGIIQWYLDEDETNTGDTPMPDRRGLTWNQINEYWIDGNNRAEAWLTTYREARK